MDKAKFSRASRIATHSTKVTERTRESEQKLSVTRHRKFLDVWHG